MPTSAGAAFNRSFAKSGIGGMLFGPNGPEHEARLVSARLTTDLRPDGGHEMPFDYSHSLGTFERPINTAATDAQLLRDLGDFHSFSKQPKGILRLRSGCGLATFVLSFRFCLRDTLALSFKHHLALELNHRGKHVQHQATCCSSGVR